YRALNDANDAGRLFEAADPRQKIEDGNTRANVAHWIYGLKELGRPDRSVTADYPVYAAFQNNETRSYAAYNFQDEPRRVTFSDGFKLNVPRKAWALDRRR
ncbi:MAG TPA: glycoside hydrolase family 81, partial [Verrucomicrobiae bacterium]